MLDAGFGLRRCLFTAYSLRLFHGRTITEP
ncbi:hypothetical protein RKD30_000849 [Streptomyces pristinaespiralis]